MTDAPSSLLVVLHTAWRWIVLASAMVWVGRSVRGVIEHRLWTAADPRWAVVLVGALDVQLTSRLLLFVRLRTPASFAPHTGLTIGAIALAHWGNVSVERATPEAALKRAALFFGCTGARVAQEGQAASKLTTLRALSRRPEVVRPRVSSRATPYTRSARFC